MHKQCFMWTKDNIASQQGKIVIITGANTGLGYEDALALYEKGAHVVVACRSAEKAADAINRLQATGGSGTLEAGVLDLSDLASVKNFADNFKEHHQQLHLLINNAGIMNVPASRSADGHEAHFGVNFIGHFVLTAYLYPLLKATPGARVVTLSSGAHKWVDDIDYDNLRLEKPYDAFKQYAVSKLADLLFTIELQRRINKAGDDIRSLAAHPGITLTDLQRHVEDLETALSRYPVVMEPWQGALPTLYAAVVADVKGGEYYGPDGERELSGFPALAVISEAAQDPDKARHLWEYAEQATGVKFL